MIDGDRIATLVTGEISVLWELLEEPCLGAGHRILVERDAVRIPTTDLVIERRS